MPQENNATSPAERRPVKPVTPKPAARAEKVREEAADPAALPIVQQLLAIQQELKVAKEHANEERDFAYRSLPDILDAIKPLLKKFGCVLTFHDEIKCVTPGVVHIVGTATLTNSHGEDFSASATVREDFQRPGMMLAQMSGSSLSYCHKYACGNLFAIDDTRTESVMDPDAMSNGPARHAVSPSENVPADVPVPESAKPILKCGAQGWSDAIALSSNWRDTKETLLAEIHRRWRVPEEKEIVLLMAVAGSKVTTGKA